MPVPLPPGNMIAATLSRMNEDVQFLTAAARMIERRLTTLRTELRRLESQLKSIEYQDWTDEDSPKGETVPGVRHPAGMPVSILPSCHSQEARHE